MMKKRTGSRKQVSQHFRIGEHGNNQKTKMKVCIVDVEYREEVLGSDFV